MKKVLLLLAILALMLPILGTADIIVNFNGATSTAVETYLPGDSGDYGLAQLLYLQRDWAPISPTGGWSDNRLKAPEIKTPATKPYTSAGNALYGNSNVTTTTRQGLWGQLATPLSGDFTAEVFFNIETLNPGFAEYKIQDIFSIMWGSDGKQLEIRFFGDAGGLADSANKIQLMTQDGTTEHNVTSGANAITAGTWYFAAVVYTASTGNAEFFLKPAATAGAPTSLGTAPTGWGTFTFQQFTVGAWPNPAGSCRDIAGYVDSFAISYQALSGTNFHLLKWASGEENWNLY